MKRAMLPSVIVWLAACGGAVSSGDHAVDPDSGVGGSAGHGGWAAGSGGTSVGGSAGTGSTGLGASAGTGGSPPVGGSAGNPGAVQCAGVICDPGELCCYATAQCFDPKAAPDACPKGPPDGKCYSDVDCAPSRFCLLQHVCVGVGRCESKSLCPGYAKPACGCDGRQLVGMVSIGAELLRHHRLLLRPDAAATLHSPADRNLFSLRARR